MFQAENNVRNSFLFELCDCVSPRMNAAIFLWLLANSYGKYFQIHPSLVIRIQRFFSVKQKEQLVFFLHNAIPFTLSLEDLQLLQIIFPLFVNI